MRKEEPTSHCHGQSVPACLNPAARHHGPHAGGAACAVLSSCSGTHGHCSLWGSCCPSKAEPWGDRKAPDQQECCALLLSKQMLSLGINLASDNKVLMPLASEVDMVESRTKPLCLRSELQIFRSPSRAQHHTALLSSPRLTDESSQQPGTRF